MARRCSSSSRRRAASSLEVGFGGGGLLATGGTDGAAELVAGVVAVAVVLVAVVVAAAVVGATLRGPPCGEGPTPAVAAASWARSRSCCWRTGSSTKTSGVQPLSVTSEVDAPASIRVWAVV